MKTKGISRKGLIKKLDILFSKKVREIGYCQRCHKTENLQCAHIFSRKSKSIRWDFGNALCLCAGCHLYWWHLEPAEAILWVGTFRNLSELQKKKNDAKPLKIFHLEDKLKELKDLAK